MVVEPFSFAKAVSNMCLQSDDRGRGMTFLRLLDLRQLNMMSSRLYDGLLSFANQWSSGCREAGGGEVPVQERRLIHKSGGVVREEAKYPAAAPRQQPTPLLNLANLCQVQGISNTWKGE